MSRRSRIVQIFATKLLANVRVRERRSPLSTRLWPPSTSLKKSLKFAGFQASDPPRRTWLDRRNPIDFRNRSRCPTIFFLFDTKDCENGAANLNFYQTLFGLLKDTFRRGFLDLRVLASVKTFYRPSKIRFALQMPVERSRRFSAREMI